MVYTDYRPTPLQHYIFPTGKDDHQTLIDADDFYTRLNAITLIGSDALYMVVDERGVFREDNFQKAVATVHDAAADGGKGKGKKKGTSTANNQDETGEKTDIYKIVKVRWIMITMLE